ncbi:MAG: hypothetical protein OXJ64_10060 [Boseongicola sp.]|nr:hypothetical protein [Boseongicola sp.]
MERPCEERAAHAASTVARARDMTGLSGGSGVSREAFCWALSEEGDLGLSTLTGVPAALGLGLAAMVPQGPAGQAAD